MCLEGVEVLRGGGHREKGLKKRLNPSQQKGFSVTESYKWIQSVDERGSQVSLMTSV